MPDDGPAAINRASNDADGAVDCGTVIANEHRYILQRRAQRLGSPELGPTGYRPSGLALSGGGIRSAVYCLGVLQHLARDRLLEKFDYLSTVSGGGYIGTSLTW